MSYNSLFVNYENSIQLRLFQFTVKSDESNYLDKFDVFTEKKKERDKKQKFYEKLFNSIENEISTSFPYDPERSLSVSINRSKQKIFYLARSNDWTNGYFLTLTFDPTMVNSFDYDEVSKYVCKFIKNLKYYDPYVRVLLVPEKHKSGRYHIHGLLLGDIKNIISYSGHNIKGEKIYNFKNAWKFGFTTLSKIKNSLAVEKYIVKYCSKELLNDIKYKHRYFKSNLNCAEIERFFTYPDQHEQLLKDLYANDCVLFCNSSGKYNRVKFVELKKCEKTLDILDKYNVIC